MKHLRRLLPVLLVVLAGCATAPAGRDPLQMAQAGGMQLVDIEQDGFALTALWRVREPGQPLRIYIEGDGRAWLDRATPSADPTPRRPVALQLALADDAPNVAWLARPCQYSRARSPACNVSHWTTHRFAPQLIEVMDAAVGQLRALAQADQIDLAGHSGGAAIAVALAARRSDVRVLLTVAGNLDSEAVNRFHRVDPMPQSVNPITLAPALAALPQLHFRAQGDRIIPPELAAAFVAAGPMRSARIIDVEGTTHGDGWPQRWPALLDAQSAVLRPSDPAHPPPRPAPPPSAASTP